MVELVIPLSLLELTEQWAIQVMLTVLRFVTIALMLGGSIVAMYTDQADGALRDMVVDPPYITSIPNNIDGLMLFDCVLWLLNVIYVV